MTAPSPAPWQGLEQLRPMLVPISSLTPDPANARRHPDPNMKAIVDSLKLFGQHRPAVAQRRPDGTLVVRVGNGMLAAAQKLGWTEIAAIVTDESDVQAIGRAIADNRTAELAEWDESALLELIQASQEGGIPASLLGFDTAALAALAGSATSSGLSDPNDAPEPPTEPVSRRGDLYRLGPHRLLVGDSTCPEDVARLLDGATPGIMVTDPPYGVEYDPAWRQRAGVGGAGVATGQVMNDDRADWFAAWRLFPGAVAYVWHGGLHAAVVAESLAQAEFRVRAQIVWVKTRPILSRGAYHWQHEPAFYAARDGRPDEWRFADDGHAVGSYAVRDGETADWIGDRKQSTVWSIDVVKNDTGHGTQKPVECMARPMRNHGFLDVYDPFVGSGTSIIAAHQIGRRCFAMELDPKYADVVVARFEKFSGVKAIRERSAE